jgi:hypothetical protein
MGYLITGISIIFAIVIGSLIVLRAIRERKQERVVHEIFEARARQKRARLREMVPRTSDRD